MSPDRPQRILVVDDEEDVQVLVCRILRDMDYEVESAGEGREALDKIKAWRPDLVILDLMMPGLDGWGVLSELRETPGSPPVVLLTALGDYTTFARGVREGAAAYVCKPFRFHELVATCQKVLLEASRPPAPVSKEIRRHPRRSLRAEVEVLSRDRAPMAVGTLVNISEGGARLNLPVPLEPESSCRIAFHTPGNGVSVSLPGRVRWRSAGPDGYAHGLAFVDVSPEEDERLKKLLRPPG